MARFRHILLTLASGSALYSGMASALGLGEISLHSALNQPLDADIELLQASDLSADEIKVRLASAEDFNRSGVDRFIFLNDLRFTPILRGGRQVIRVVSSKPVREPYLNFIVELARPGGNLLREYTLLIDPPTSAAYRQLAAPLERTAPPAIQESRTTPVPVQPRAKPAALQGRQYQVQAGDNLWGIAGRVEDGRSRDVVMADILALNPQAFIGGDRNRLRAHAQLLLPDSTAPTQTQSVAVVPAPATPVQQAPVAPQQVVLDQAAVDAELASEMAKNQELQQAIGDLQSQLQQLQQQMAEKDRQLAQIHNELARREPVVEPPVEPVAAVAPVAVPVAPVSAPATPWAGWLGPGLLCLILLGGVWLLARRRMPQDQPEPLRQVYSAPSAVAPTSVPLPARDEDEEPAQVVPVATPEPPRAPVSTDALEGANIYIAYGRFGEAALALRTAIEREPQRLDLRLRLLEVLGELGDANGFAEQERGLLALGAEPTQVEQIRARYDHLWAEQVDELTAVWRQEEPVVAASELSDDFQLNLDDLSLDTDWSLDSPFKPAAPIRSKTLEVPVDEAFRSNLSELPEVFELTVDKELLSPFGEPVSAMEQEVVLDEAFVDAFAPEPLGHGHVLVASNLEHLAADREHLVRLNMALAYIEQGDIGSACDILNDVISSGDAQEQQRARELLAKLA